MDLSFLCASRNIFPRVFRISNMVKSCMAMHARCHGELAFVCMSVQVLAALQPILPYYIIAAFQEIEVPK